MTGRTPSRAERTSAFLRTFAIQGSWNYRTMVGGGLAYAMLPLLKCAFAGDPVALRRALERHASSFNGHPYLCAMAVGALARLELEGRDPSQIDRFRTALAGPLGALGDRLVWAGWRPFCALAAVCAYGLGRPAWQAVVLFLAAYNAGHLWLRVWAYRRGWRAGLDVGKVLADAPLNRVAGVLIVANAALLGAAAVLVASRVPGEATPLVAGVAGLGAAAAFLLPGVGGPAAILLIAGGLALGMIA